MHKVSIIPRGVGALGYTIQRPTEDRFVITREELRQAWRCCSAAAPRSGSIFQHLSTGAADDLAKATDIARDMATRFGMVETLGPVAYESAPSPFLAGPPGARGRERPALQRRDGARHRRRREVDRRDAVRSDCSDAHGSSRNAAARRELLLEHETLDESALKPLRDELDAPRRSGEQIAV